jgi:hypothetical protein
MVWYDVFDSVFFLSIATALLGTAAICGRQIYKSKCSEFKLCCFSIKRDTRAEEDIDMAEQGRIGVEGRERAEPAV